MSVFRANKYISIFLILILSLPSCIVQSPKYTTLDRVMSLQIGMTKPQVEKTLDLQPYDLKAYTDTSNVFIYVYRVNDRRTIPFFTRRKNGIRSTGKYVQLFVAYSKKDSTVINVESCSECADNLVTSSKIDFAKVFSFVTVTVPVILVYIGLKK